MFMMEGERDRGRGEGGEGGKEERGGREGRGEGRERGKLQCIELGYTETRGGKGKGELQ